MSNILLVTSSPRGAASHSTRVATELATKLQAALPGSTVTTRDLVANPLPHIEPDYATGIYTPAEARTPRQTDLVSVSDVAVDELFAADHIVLATGFINFSISSTLKSWVDHISRSGKTFSYTANGPKGLVTGKKVYVVLASGGIYSEGPAAVMDFAVPYLKSVLAFNGMTDVEVIRVEGVGMGEDAVKAALANAGKQVDAIAASATEIALSAAAA
ncbi:MULTISPECIES: FMN-dependent NADH-azoreductase [Phyllobacteriaceae]|jgi:FMN-dependent NADH-azoreductase|uniref:FMN dependent NADH:quinone oxidoreductase n=1 Tax=Mesorhizobium hungaricum TaxID=1566387 RepID=A0A1C2DYW1_9HYPH|nr:MULTISPECIES: FMN-dependent NADH-azoreductase [Mesorhizobium]MBN9234599.1 FMN-dependent NADH-azoreductase [Mesorhizobium sp.]MDQ0328921.1 FMN-dependent NADH-azoreductase [Mesorhizobium sp. YL-MeA3-2017]OCX19959.1 FMN-dependent NADH-azoreductase [Mesorhizobium hungaricum]